MSWWNPISWFEGAGDAMGLGNAPTAQTPNPRSYSYMGGKKARDEYLGRLDSERQAIDARQAPQLDYGQADQARGLLLESQQGYGDVISGKAPSLAAQQMAAGQAQAAQQGYQMAASARGGAGNQLLAQRAAQRQAGDASLGVARDTSMLRSQEVASARQGQAQTAQALLGADMARQQQFGQMQMQQRELNDQRAYGLLGAEQHVYDQQMAGQMGSEQAAQQNAQFNAQQVANVQANRRQFVGGMTQGIASGAVVAAGG